MAVAVNGLSWRTVATAASIDGVMFVLVIIVGEGLVANDTRLL
jgi:hypothetical protein